ncbi:MAG: helix-turn-helix domain-containing protein [Oscillospiraceae bacterium]|nr:helix-turn-helix domain-containing protein [Oscillospiraceae bacterium]
MYQILVAEDESLERKVLCKTLKKHFGDLCQIHEAKNGREAVEAFLIHRPQVAILDIEMPGVTGLEAARQIRESGHPCMILFLTAFDKFSYAREAITLRALDYLLKPCQEQELILTVEEALHLYDRLGANPEAVLRGDIADGAGEEDLADRRMGQIRENIQRYIREHYSTEISMQSVARAMNYSDAYFCKLFKQCFKVNFSAWLNEYRIDRAREMLQNTRLSVREVSTACGYSDANYFARVFKRVTGKTPSEYRNG